MPARPVVTICRRRGFLVQHSKGEPQEMKKLMSLMLGLAFLGTTVTVVFADDAAKDTTKTEKKQTKKPAKAKKTTEAKKTS